MEHGLCVILPCCEMYFTPLPLDGRIAKHSSTVAGSASEMLFSFWKYMHSETSALPTSPPRHIARQKYNHWPTFPITHVIHVRKSEKTPNTDSAVPIMTFARLINYCLRKGFSRQSPFSKCFKFYAELLSQSPLLNLVSLARIANARIA